MAAPSTLTVTFTGGASSPQTIPIPTQSAGSVAGVANPVTPMDFTLAVKNIFLNGGFWYVSATGVNTFVPASQITSVSAQ
jgi:hypothetical protein